MYYLGIDLGSSSIKIAVLNAENGNTIFSVTSPETEMEIEVPRHNWAEQSPDLWWKYVKEGLQKIKTKHHFDLKKIKAIGIAYQMHGLVLVDENLNPVRKSIIWCDSRAVDIGNDAYQKIGKEFCNENLLGSPANFTASKLKWVQENEPKIYAKAKYILLPGDYIAAKLSGVAQISVSGLSEAMLWNFPKQKLATTVLDKLGLDVKQIPEIVPNFGFQAKVNSKVASELNLNPNTTISYRAGDQPNNAFSLNVLQPGEIATTAGTSAVIYSVSNKNVIDQQQRINTFLHVNNTVEEQRNGVMACINGSGILYQWLRNLISIGRTQKVSYQDLNSFSSKVQPGSNGLQFYPFGNGVERIFSNQNAFSGIENLNFNIHKPEHIIRAACEGIVFAMNYGFEVMKSLGVSGKVVKAGQANLFLSPVFREIFCNTTQTSLELYNTSGAEGAARGAALGDVFYSNQKQAFKNLTCVSSLEPNKELSNHYQEIYQNWKSNLKFK